jgi:hypothetical protein
LLAGSRIREAVKSIGRTAAEREADEKEKEKDQDYEEEQEYEQD